MQATADPAFETDPGRVLRFGAQVDARPVSVRHRDDDPDQPLTPEQVAGYIAKYATKSAADTFDAKPGQRPRCTCSASARLVEQFGAHAREESRIHYPADPSPYVRMGRWVHMLGFRGHFSTKSRRYSVTLGRLRRARRRWHTIAADAARTGTPLDVAEPGSQAPGRRRRHRDHPRRRGLDVRRRRVDHRRRRRPGPCRCRPRP
nr:replication initiator [Angustibacter aerolatus]